MNLVNQSAGLSPQSRPRTLHIGVEKQSKHQNPAQVCTSWRRSRIIHKSTPWYQESGHSAPLQPFLPGQTYKAQLPVLHASKLNSLAQNDWSIYSKPLHTLQSPTGARVHLAKRHKNKFAETISRSCIFQALWSTIRNSCCELRMPFFWLQGKFNIVPNHLACSFLHHHELAIVRRRAPWIGRPTKC